MATPVPERDSISLPPDGRPLDEQPAWRQDFPIDWPQDQYVERRDFVKFLTLTSFAFVFGQLWIAGKSWMRQREPAPGARRIASRHDLAIGQSLVFDYPHQHDSCVLVRVADAEFVAFSQKCTHLSCAVIPRPGEGVLHCPCHEGVFDLRSGRVLAGPPPRPLPRITLEISGDDIYATGVETRTV
ncbi:MAG TPA: ubiquinol-cytochrome c reductase iron-sulfur subunit [Vicinamibacterales bacterium]|jgi:nitrite reductase/ring-hydroxylating ferredoxin subunit